jgi:hypothetical protein
MCIRPIKFDLILISTCLNEYRPIAVTSVATKCFERLVMPHINNILLDTLDPLQFAYRPNRVTNYPNALHTALSHLDKRNTYLRMLFIDYSSVFNTLVPTKHITKLRTLGLNTSFCNWILDFLTGRPQVVRLGNNTSATMILNMGLLRGACLVPSCPPCSPMTAWPSTTPIPSLSLLTTTVVGLNTDNDETAYREEVRDLAVPCKDNNLSLNVSKTKELIVKLFYSSKSQYFLKTAFLVKSL